MVPLRPQVLIDTYYLMTGKDLADDEPLIPNLEILKDSCGCLLSFQTDEDDDFTVSLAHYTVREYLETSRSSAGQSRLFARNGRTSYRREATAVFNQLLELEAQVDLEEMRTRRELRDYGGVIAVNTSTYRLLTGLKIASMGKIEVQPSLIFDFLNPQKPQFRHLLSVVIEVWEDLKYREFVGDFLSLDLTPSGDPTGAVVMANLLWLRRLDLAAELLQRPGIWQAQLSGEVFVTVCTSGDCSGEFRTFSGKIVELFAMDSGEQTPDALGFLLDHALDRFDPTSVLVHFVGTHYHRPHETCTRDCPLQRLLKWAPIPMLEVIRVRPSRSPF